MVEICQKRAEKPSLHNVLPQIFSCNKGFVQCNCVSNFSMKIQICFTLPSYSTATELHTPCAFHIFLSKALSLLSRLPHSAAYSELRTLSAELTLFFYFQPASRRFIAQPPGFAVKYGIKQLLPMSCVVYRYM